MFHNSKGNWLTWCFVLVWFCTIPSLGGVKDSTWQIYNRRKINLYITPQKVFALSHKVVNSPQKASLYKNKLKSFSKNTVFWTGTVKKFLTYPQNYWILMKSDDGIEFWVYAKKSIRNLDFNREGFRIGVKGNIVLKDGVFGHLRAKSVVLIQPPPFLSYKKFVKTYSIPKRILVKTSRGSWEIKSPYYPFILHRIYIHNPHYSWNLIKSIASNIVYYSHKYKLDPLLVTALINIESAFDVDAVSPSGAIGLGQLMPSTARGLGVNPKDPSQNIAGSVKYFYYQMRQWKGYKDQVDRALASYNAGAGAVRRYGGVPPYSETENYVFFIKFLHKEYLKQIRNTN